MSRVETGAASTPPPAGGAERSAASPPGQQIARQPDFFIVGQPKSGTTALYEMLRRQPRIFMPDVKESWFFAEELHERTPPRPGGMPKDLQEYLSLFAGAGADAGQLRGEASPLYLWSATAAERIAAVQPEARIIAILREPASLLRSLHLQFLRSYIEVETDFRTALSLEDERRRGRSVPAHTYWPQALVYSEHVRYVDQLRRYRDAFGEDQMLILVYDDFRRDNAAAVAQVLRFLGVEDNAPIEPLDANESVGVRSRHMHRVVNARGPLARVAKSAARTLLPADLRRRARQRLLFSTPPEPDEAFMAELRERFHGEVVALSEYLGRDLVSLWSDDVKL